MTEHQMIKNSSKGYGATDGDEKAENWAAHDRADDEIIGDIERSDARVRNNTYIEETHGASHMASVKHYLGASLSNFRGASLRFV